MTAQHCAESEKPGEERVLSTGSGCGVGVGDQGHSCHPPYRLNLGPMTGLPEVWDWIHLRPPALSCPTHGHPHLVYYSGHELWVWLLVGQKLSNDFVHDILRWEEVVEELRQDPCHNPGFTGKPLADPVRRGADLSFTLVPGLSVLPTEPTWTEAQRPLTHRDAPSGAQTTIRV